MVWIWQKTSNKKGKTECGLQKWVKDEIWTSDSFDFVTVCDTTHCGAVYINLLFTMCIFQDLQNTFCQGRKDGEKTGKEIQKKNPIHKKEEESVSEMVNNNTAMCSNWKKNKEINIQNFNLILWTLSVQCFPELLTKTC